MGNQLPVDIHGVVDLTDNLYQFDKEYISTRDGGQGLSSGSSSACI
jgi:hypothetical protein